MAPAHRWAIGVDDGRLIFTDTEDLTIGSSTRRYALTPESAAPGPVGFPGD
ncbi:hypothetical protein [Rhodococcus jostii]|uniref:hypothetical protein n=1 Tax=Rhodococcus jostii TaxID=132919 RepID=UPI00362CD67D